VSRELATKIQLNLEELATLVEQFKPLTSISVNSGSQVGVVETSAACAMLHSFYTEIEKILFRGASIVLMQWDKISPLVIKVDRTHRKVRSEINSFVRWLQEQSDWG
jgi:hypothetical protein